VQLASVALAIVLGWDAYPLSTTSSAAYPIGMRCYVTYAGATTRWSQISIPPPPARMSGACYPDSLIDTIPFVGRASFYVRGFNATGESSNSNEWRLCSCAYRAQPPPVTGAANDGECVIYQWIGVETQCLTHSGWCSCTGAGCIDRSELLGCVTAP
jgi:hypothetical protein